MALCQICRGLGNWLLSGANGDEWLLGYVGMSHHGSWRQLETSATNGCHFCHYIVAYFNDWGSYHVHWYKPDDTTFPEAGKSWVEQIEELQAQGKPTQIMIMKGNRKNNTHRIFPSCNNVGKTSIPGLDVYTPLDGKYLYI